MDEEDWGETSREFARLVFGSPAFKPDTEDRTLAEVRTLVLSWIANQWRGMSKQVDRDRIAMEKLEVEVQEIMIRM